MSDAITDTAGQPLLYVNLNLEAGADSVVVVTLVPCKSGTKLSASIDSRAQVLARLSGSGNPFVDIATSPLDLSAFAGTTQSYDFKVRAGSVTGLERVAMAVRVTFNP